MRQKRTIRYTTDFNGREIVKVGLAQARECTLDKADFEQLMGLGISPIWSCTKPKGVLCWARKWKRWISLARVIVDAGPRSNVIFADGNRLNLRNNNLVTTSDRRGQTKLRARDGIEPSHGWYKKVIFSEPKEKAPDKTRSTLGRG